MPPTGSAESGPEHYLAVLKAAYDYEPQSEDEIAIQEAQLLLLVERTDEDWWKVKVKGETQDDEGPVGLVPAAYVEQAEHTSLVKVLYSYEAVAPGELSVNEEDTLLLFETDGDWILAQSHTGDGAGYVPGNYVETASADEPAPQPSLSEIVVPESPPRPSATYEDPADRVQAHKLSADDIKTWSVSEVDKKGKKKKGTLGIGNGSLFFASESDKKWQTSDVTDASIDKPKHVQIEIAGANATSLHFHAGSKEGAEEILAKVQSSKALATATSSSNGSEAPTTRRLPPMADPKSMKKPSVHFSTSEPVIIPPRPQAEEGTDDEEETPDVKGENASALYEFKADGEDELSVAEGEQLIVLERDDDDWWKCRNAMGAEGVVPAQYVQLQTANSNGAATSSRAQDNEAQEKAERLAREQAEREEAELAEEERRREEERRHKKMEADKPKPAAVAAQAERDKPKKDQPKPTTPKSPPRPETDGPTSPSGSSSKSSSELGRPPPDKTRTWHDRSGQFRVDAAFLGFNGGKLRLHKVNGVVVEVPAEKMSLEDMKYVERAMSKKGQDLGEDVPLAIAARVNAASGSNGSQGRAPPPPKKGPKIDWFDFFLGAGCDMDDCTRYAASFERDKIDETILPDVTDSTMRSLGLKEGDIIRVKKAIEKRRPNENLVKPSPYLQEQIKRDEELAKQLQAQENSGRGAAPNLFAGPGGVLKNPRRGRPQPTKSLPSGVDIKAIDSASEAIQRTSSPQASTPLSAQPTSNAVNAPPRSSSALAAPSSGFDDNAWTPRPSSTKPLVGTPPPQNRAPSAPPAAPAKAPTPPAPAPAPAVAATPPAPQPPAVAQSTTPSLAKTTESDIFEQLARLSNLRAASAPVPSPQQQVAPILTATPSIQTPSSFHAGMGVSNSPIPLGQLQAHTPTLTPNPQQLYIGPRGPFAPVPANQGLLQPLIPTQTGFNSFVPTRAPIVQNLPPMPMQTGMLQPTMGGLSPPQMSPNGLLPQQTGMPMNGGFNSGGFGVGQMPFQNNPGFGQMQPLQPQMTSFNPAGNNMFNSLAAPSLPAAPVKDNSPANIFASMKSGTFEDDNQNNSGPRPPDMYDALRTNPSPLQMQPTGWGQPAYGMGYQR
ncbi:hypothetical protein EST38_g582 [Candolleomyces aberdarensis]|uniref:Actin cytoskeleton-regulatory complex protein SLA1 n=1 Tax=Candolleomyces aberdarensis TaxID=2316362 RepID=A0A4Q2DY51_9AGAR|nr:hypothetical protein EST38_g582 [Candolleomyces aberdarensis]